MDEVKRLGNIYGENRGTGFAGNVWDKNGILPALTTMQGGGREPMILDKICVAMRGRNPEKPTNRTPGLITEQRFEVNQNGTVNTLTTVQRDNLVLEKKIQKVGQISNEGSQCGTVVSDEGLSPTLSAGTHGYANPHTIKSEKNMSERQNSIKAKKLPNGNIRFYRDDEKKSAVSELQVQSKDNVAQAITTANVPKIYAETIYRIRKLTPRECWRLMGYTDADFNKAQKVNSNSQLYKEAGNAIVKQVLMAIFAQMIPESARQK